MDDVENNAEKDVMPGVLNQLSHVYIFYSKHTFKI